MIGNICCGGVAAAAAVASGGVIERAVEVAGTVSCCSSGCRCRRRHIVSGVIYELPGDVGKAHRQTRAAQAFRRRP